MLRMGLPTSLADHGKSPPDLVPMELGAQEVVQ